MTDTRAVTINTDETIKTLCNHPETMQAVSDAQLRREFLGWQCRIRQLAMRQHGGRPSPGMRPKVLDMNGAIILEAMTVVLVPSEAEEFTRFFQFQIQKTPDPKQSYDAALKLLQGTYFQKPKTFSDTLAAQFAPGSGTAARLLDLGECLLDFGQFSQSWKMRCTIRELAGDDAVRQHVIAHNRIFNRNIPGDAVVLAFSPHWHSANADPAP